MFIGAIGALAVMTVLSAYLGALASLIPRLYTLYLSTALFVIFGLKMLHEGYNMEADEGQEELEEVTLELKKKDEELETKSKQVLLFRRAHCDLQLLLSFLPSCFKPLH